MILRPGRGLACTLAVSALLACNKKADTVAPEPAATVAAKPPADGEGELEDPEESPYLDSSNFNDAVETHLSEIVACYKDTVGKAADAPTGRVRVTVVVESQGTVKDVSFDAQRSTLKDDKLQACISERVKTWRFNISLTGADTPMPYTFDLSASGLLKG